MANVVDTFTSNDSVEYLLGLGIGPIKGLVNGPKTFYADQTPITDFDNFQLTIHPGLAEGDTVNFVLGGASLPIEVAQKLSQNAAVTRSGVRKGHNRVDLRIAIQSLYLSTSKGVKTTPLQLKFEVRKSTESAWQPAQGYIGASTPVADPNGDYPPDGDLARYLIKRGLDQTYVNPNTYSFGEDRSILIVAATPTSEQPDRTLAWNKNTSALYVRTSGAWQPVPVSGGVWTDTDGVERKLFPRLPTPINPTPGDLWIKSSSNDQLLIFNGVAWVAGGSSLAQSQTPQTVLTNGIWAIDAKVSSIAAKDVSIFIEPDEEVAYQYRITKLSADSGPSGDDERSSEIFWESIQEVTTGAHTSYGVALAHIVGQASDRFTSNPNWSGDFDLKLVKIPSNYDPIARTYTGIWDGTYKIDWTNCPAFCLQDLIENDEYGLSKMYLQTVDKWAFYEFGRHCDTPVQRPDGSWRPRWTYNDVLTEAREVKEACSFIAGAAGALWVDDGNGYNTVIVDQDRSAVALFTAENVSPEGFSYSYTDRLTRPNRVIAEYVNPDLNWENDKAIDQDDDDIATFGLIEEKFVAVGCTDPDEAVARARLRLITGLTEKEIVTFKTNRKGVYLTQFETILVADPDVGRGLSGRISYQESVTEVVLRDPIVLEAGITYWATFEVVEDETAAPFRTFKAEVISPAGEASSLVLATAIPWLPENAVFSLEAEDILGLPKPYRVLSIADVEGDGEQIEIEAIEINRSKWSYTDNGGAGDAPTYSIYEKKVRPPTDLKVKVETRQVGNQSIYAINLSWTKSLSKLAQVYRVYHAIDGVPADSKETKGTAVDFEITSLGVHQFTVIAINGVGRESDPATVSFDFDGLGRPQTGAFPLFLVSGSSDFAFDTPDAAFRWEPPTASPTFDHYQVEVIDPETITDPEDVTSGEVLRSVSVAQAVTWTYLFDQMVEDGEGAPRREFRVNVYAVDQSGERSAPASILVSNPVPNAPTVAASGSSYGIDVRLSDVNPRDLAGAYVWVSSTSGFNPLTTTPTIEALGQSTFFIPCEPGTYYVRAAYYDGFGKNPTELNITEVQSVTVSSILGTRTVAEVNQALDDLSPVAEAAEELADFIANTAPYVTDLRGAVATANAEAKAAAYATIQTAIGAAKAHRAIIDASYVDGQKPQAYATEVRGIAENAITQVTELGVVVGDNMATVGEYIAIQATINTATASRLETVEAKVDDSEATFSDFVTTQAGVNKATVEALTTLTAKVDDSAASATSFITAQAEANKATASSLEALNTKFEGSEASFESFAIAQSKINSAQSGFTTAVNADLELFKSTVSTTYASKSYADAAVSSYDTSIKAWVEGDSELSSTVSTNSSTIATATGQLYGSHGFKINAGGAVTSMLAYASDGATETSGIAFQANAFSIQAGSASSTLKIAPFTYDATSGTLFVNSLTIRRGNIQGAAIATALGFDWTGGVTLTTSNADVGPGQSVTVSDGVADIFIDCFVYAENTAASSGQDVTVKLYKDGSLFKQRFFKIAIQNQGHVNFPVLDLGVSGSHTYSIKATATPGGSDCTATAAVLRLMPLFRTGA